MIKNTKSIIKEISDHRNNVPERNTRNPKTSIEETGNSQPVLQEKKIRNLNTIVREDLINLIKNPMWLFFAALFPLLMWLLMGFMTRSSYGHSFTSFDYYRVAIMIYSAFYSGTISANAFLEERIKKPNMRIIYAPGHARNIFLSKIIASFLFCFSFHAVDICVMALLFPTRTVHSVFLLLFVALSDLFAVTFGILLCCIVKQEGVTNQIQSILINILAFFGGVFFPLAGMGAFIRSLSLLSPIKWIVTDLFRLLYDNNFQHVSATIILLLAGTAAMILLCHLTFRKEDCIC